VHVEESLDVTASGASHVTYSGEATVTEDISGASDVKKAPVFLSTGVFDLHTILIECRHFKSDGEDCEPRSAECGLLPRRRFNREADRKRRSHATRLAIEAKGEEHARSNAHAVGEDETSPSRNSYGPGRSSASGCSKCRVLIAENLNPHVQG